MSLINSNLISRIHTDCAKWDSDKKYQDGEIIPMWVADMEFPSPKPIQAAMQARLEHPFYSYTYDEGNKMAKAFMKWCLEEYHWAIKNEWISFTSGVLASLSIVIHALTRRGDKILICSPVYYPFEKWIVGNERLVENVPLINIGNEFSYNFEQIKKSASDNSVKLAIICNPHNPVGKVPTKPEMETLGNIFVENGIPVFADEIHSDIIFSSQTYTPYASICPEFANHSITAHSPSKTFNVAGLGISSVLIPNPELRETFLQWKAPLGHGQINCFAIPAYVAAYQECRAYKQAVIHQIEKNAAIIRTFLLENVPEIVPYKHEGTYLMWLDCSGLNLSDKDLETFFLEKVGISVDFGNWFGKGGQSHIRLNIAFPEQVIIAVLKKIEKAMRELKGVF